MSNISRLFSSTLQHSAAWQSTLNDPENAATFACIINHTNCATACSGGICGGTFKVTDAAGSALSGFSLSTQADGITAYGFDSSWVSCNRFNSNSGQGNDSCPYSLSLTWKPLCSPGNCINPQIAIEGKWKFNSETPARTISFNSANYDFKILAGVGRGWEGFYRSWDNVNEWQPAQLFSAAATQAQVQYEFAPPGGKLWPGDAFTSGFSSSPQGTDLVDSNNRSFCYNYQCSSPATVISGACRADYGNTNAVLRTSSIFVNGWLCCWDNVSSYSNITASINFYVTVNCQ